MHVLTPTQKKNFRKHITDYCLRSEANRLHRDYTQQRPVRGYMLPPEVHQYDDCSGYDSKACNWAMHKSGVYVRDPLNNHYTGNGNTQSIYEYLKHSPAPQGKYLVGDIALWGTPSKTVHTAICRLKGNEHTALFSSHGHESWAYGNDAPNAYNLDDSHQHLIGVYRLPELK